MPFGLYDPDGNLFPKMNAPRIQVVVPLAELEECRQNTERDLLSLYRDHGLLVLHLPIPNYGVPSNGVVAFMGSGGVYGVGLCYLDYLARLVIV